MTRKSKRELERALEERTDDGDDHDMDSWTKTIYDVGPKYFDQDGNVVPTDEDGDPIVPSSTTLIILDGRYADPETVPDEVLEWYDQNGS